MIDNWCLTTYTVACIGIYAFNCVNIAACYSSIVSVVHTSVIAGRESYFLKNKPPHTGNNRILTI